MRQLLLGFAIAAGGLAAELPAQTAFPTGRQAALQYAITHGIAVDAARTVIIAESSYMNSHAPAPSMTNVERVEDAKGMARIVGPSVRVSRAADVLECWRSYCAARGNQSVIQVNEALPHAGSYESLVMLFSPAKGNDTTAPRGMLTLMKVVLRHTQQGWVAVSGPSAPTIVPVAVPPR